MKAPYKGEKNNACLPPTPVEMLGTMYPLYSNNTISLIWPLYIPFYRFFGTNKLGLFFFRGGPPGGPDGRLVC